MSGETQSTPVARGGGVEQPLVSGEKYSVDYVVGDGSQNQPNAALSEATQLFKQFHFKASSITFLADTNNAGTIYIGGKDSAKFPLANGYALSDRHVRLDTVAFRGDTKNDILHVTFVAE